MIMNELQGAVEAILFAAGEPLEIERICQALECEKEPVEDALKGIDESLKSINSGIRLVKMDDMYQLCTRQEYADKVRTVPITSRSQNLLVSRSEVLTAPVL